MQSLVNTSDQHTRYSAPVLRPARNFNSFEVRKASEELPHISFAYNPVNRTPECTVAQCALGETTQSALRIAKEEFGVHEEVRPTITSNRNRSRDCG
jgi:hypothetical protein